MNETQNILLECLRLAIHPGQKAAIPHTVDWFEVYEESKKQNVSAIVWDAISLLQAEGLIVLGENQQLRKLIFQWYGFVNLHYQRYAIYQKAIRNLSRFFSEKGLHMMMLKGYGCSLDYPNPQARPCGDIDIWMFGKQKEADEWVRNDLGLTVQTENEHHSTFNFEGFTIENHGTIQDINIHKSEVYLNNILVQLADEEVQTVVCDGEEILIPSVRFNSIHLLRHMACDFATFTTSLRHVLDWSTFVYKHSDQFDWNFVRKVAHKANMHQFLDAINGICVQYLGYPASMFPIESLNDALRDRVMDDILNNHDRPNAPEGNLSFFQKLEYVFAKSVRLWRNRWKYQIVYDESLLASFLTLGLNRITHFK